MARDQPAVGDQNGSSSPRAQMLYSERKQRRGEWLAASENHSYRVELDARLIQDPLEKRQVEMPSVSDVTADAVRAVQVAQVGKSKPIVERVRGHKVSDH